MSSIKDQVLAQQQGQYNESDDKYLSTLKQYKTCLLYTSPSPRDCELSRMPSSA